jgi:type II secretory pathway component GspD/PulD (secretin)
MKAAILTMKSILSASLLALALGLTASGEQTSSPPSPAEDPAPDPGGAPAPQPGAVLRFNFRGAALESVLNYVGEAAGFVVVLQTPVTGTVDMWSAQPLSRAEALDLLEIALNKNGFSATVEGRTLIVSSKDQAKKGNIPIHTGADPAAIPLTGQMVIQIVPLRHIDAAQAVKDLASLIPSSATLTANQDSNSLVVTDTEMNVHHIVEILAALDSSIETVSTTRVFRLKNADPVEMATLLGNVYGSPGSTTAGGNLPGQVRPGFAGGGGNAVGGGFGPGGGFGGGGGGAFRGGGFAAAVTAAAAQAAHTGGRSIPVVAIPDPRTLSVVVTASKEQMPDIADMIARLDGASGRKQHAYTITMENADVQQVQAILQNLFQSSTQRTSTTTQADPLSTRATNNATANNNTAASVNLVGSSNTEH